MTDYISREVLIEHLRKDPLFDLVERYGITGVINSIPAADVRPVVRGRWEKCRGGDMCICSACYKYYIAVDEQYDFNFCPNCGADMRAKPPKEET